MKDLNIISVLLLDIRDATLEVKIEEFIRPIFFCLWLMILFMPLKNIDRRDPIAGLMFSLYCTAAGAALLFAIPQHILPDFRFKVVLISICLMAIVSAMRWFLRPQFFIEKD